MSKIGVLAFIPFQDFVWGGCLIEVVASQAFIIREFHHLPAPLRVENIAPWQYQVEEI